MLDARLVEILNDCIDRMAQGASVDDCLRAYPAHAQALLPLLESGLVTRRALPADGEVAMARARSASRLEQALRETPRPRAAPYRPWLYAAARLAAVLLIVMVGAIFAAEAALPGDALYPLKRLSEDVRVGLGGGETARQAYGARRLEETRALLDQGRSAFVTFDGTVEVIAADSWQVSGIMVMVTGATTVDTGIDTGDAVEVSGITTPERTLLASSLRLTGDHVQQLQPSQTPTPTPAVTPTYTPTVTPTVTPTTPPNTAIPTLMPAPTVTATLTPPSAGCVPGAPTGWVRYAVRAGDSLSALAVASGTTLQELERVNCIPDPSTLFIGQVVLLPRLPAVVTQSDGPGTGTGPGPGGAHTQEPADDHHDDDNSGRGSDNSGSGSGNSGSGGGGGGDDH